MSAHSPFPSNQEKEKPFGSTAVTSFPPRIDPTGRSLSSPHETASTCIFISVLPVVRLRTAVPVFFQIPSFVRRQTAWKNRKEWDIIISLLGPSQNETMLFNTGTVVFRRRTTSHWLFVFKYDDGCFPSCVARCLSVGCISDDGMESFFFLFR